MKIVLNANDITKLLDVSESHARAILRKTRKKLGKAPRSYITVGEFAQVHNIPQEEIQEALNPNN